MIIRNPFTGYRDGIITPSVLGLTEDEFSEVRTYVTEHLDKVIEIPKPVQPFRFGQSIVQTPLLDLSTSAITKSSI